MDKNSTSSRIKRFISALADGGIFTTRDLIGMGSRSAIDSTLWRMVKTGFLVRLANGVFTRSDRHFKPPSYYELARIKAAAFHKRIVTDGEVVAGKLGLKKKIPEPVRKFMVEGCSSSFVDRIRNVRITLLGASKRKTVEGDSDDALVIRALWSLGRKNARVEHFEQAHRRCNIRPWFRLGPLARLMPDWMARFFPWYETCVNEAGRIGKRPSPPLRTELPEEPEAIMQYWLDYVGFVGPETRGSSYSFG